MASPVSLAALNEPFAHDYWTRDRQLKASAYLTSEQFLRPLGGSFPSLAIPWCTCSLWSGYGWNAGAGWSPRGLLPPEEFPTLAAVRERWQAVEQYLVALPEEVLEQPLTCTSTAFAPAAPPPPTQDRGEIPVRDAIKNKTPWFCVNIRPVMPAPKMVVPASNRFSRTNGLSPMAPAQINSAPPQIGSARISRAASPGFQPIQGISNVPLATNVRPSPPRSVQRNASPASLIARWETRPAPPVFKPAGVRQESMQSRPGPVLLGMNVHARAALGRASVQAKSQPQRMRSPFPQPPTGSPHRFGIIQRAVVAAPDLAPWQVFPDWLEDWFNDEGYRHQQPTVRRVAQAGGQGVSVDYDIEFTWANAFPYDGQNWNVVAHLHVRNELSQGGGGIWVTGLAGTGINWNTIPGHGNFRAWMDGYIE
jgi:hypothetical protein